MESPVPPRHRLAAAVALAVALSVPAAWAGRRVLSARDLGTFEGADTYGIAINDRGQIVGVTGIGTTINSFLWDSGTTTDLGRLAVADINNSGQILLQETAGNPDDPTQCFLRDPDGTLAALGTPAGSQCFAADLSDRGQVTGSIQRLVGTLRVTSGFLWDGAANTSLTAGAGTVTDLGTLGGDIVLPLAMNDLGQVVGGATTPSGYEHAFFWDQGTMLDLGAPGGTSSRATAINNRGQVVLASGAHVYLWEAGTTTDLGTMGGPESPSQTSVPLDINERGQILIAVYDTAAAAFRWGIWSAGRRIDLPSIGGGQPSANRLNELGQVIGTDRLITAPTRHMVLWVPTVVRGRRVR